MPGRGERGLFLLEARAKGEAAMAIAEELAALRERTLAEIEAACDSTALEAVRVAVLGKSGTLTGYLRSMGSVPPEERAAVGKAVNAARGEIEEALAAAKASIAEIGRASCRDRVSASV